MGDKIKHLFTDGLWRRDRWIYMFTISLFVLIIGLLINIEVLWNDIKLIANTVEMLSKDITELQNQRALNVGENNSEIIE